MNALQFALSAFLVAGMLGLSALLLETVLEAIRVPRRWLWLTVIAASVLIPFAMSIRIPLPAQVDAATPGLSNGLAVFPSERTISNFVPEPARQVTQRLVASDRSRSIEPLVRYLFGAALFLVPLWLLFEQRWVHRQKKHWRTMTVDGVSLYVSEDFGPAVVGLFRPLIVIPALALDLPSHDRRLLIAHEEEHVRARDGLTLFVALMSIAVTPWNLIIWWQLSRLRAAVEMDCDDRVLRRFDARSSYAKLLIDMAERTVMPVTATGFMSRLNSTLHQRVKRIIQPVQRFSRTRVASTTLGAAITIVLALTLPRILTREVSAQSASAVAHPLWGWAAFGKLKQQYELLPDSVGPESERADILVRAKRGSDSEGASLMQFVAADSLRGKRILFTGQLRASGATDSTILIAAAYDKCSHLLQWDDGVKRAVTGSTGWTNFRVVMDLPQDADYFMLGVAFNGAGEFRVRDIALSLADAAVPATASSPSEPSTWACKSRTETFQMPLPYAPSDFEFTDALRKLTTEKSEPAARAGTLKISYFFGFRAQEDSTAIQVMNLNRSGRHADAERLGEMRLAALPTIQGNGAACAVLIGVTYAQALQDKRGLATSSIQRFDRECQGATFSDFFPAEADRVRRVVAGESANSVYRVGQSRHVVKDSGATDVMMLNREGRWSEAEAIGLTFLAKHQSEPRLPEGCAVLIGVTHAQHYQKKAELAARSLERLDRDCAGVVYLDWFPRVADELRRTIRGSPR
ncbi:MAG: M56 family metallopeptidase [Gemmatimonadaceae bacterium]|nr:M56 family metallopeptidase [Gemmatimonadaceae bacterium]